MEEDKSNQDLVIGGDGSLSDGHETGPEAAIIDVSTNKESPGGASSDSVFVDTMTAPLIDNKELNANEPLISESPIENEVTERVPVQAPEVDESLSDAAALQETNTPSDNSSSVDFAQNSIISQVVPNIKGATAHSDTPSNTKAKVDKQPNRNNKTFAVVITIAVALILSGVAVFVYISAQENTEKAVDTNTPTIQTPETQSPSDIQNNQDSNSSENQSITSPVDEMDTIVPPTEDQDATESDGSGTDTLPGDTTNTPTSPTPTTSTPSN